MTHTLDQLFALGFESNVGHLDFRGKTYGRIVDGAPVLTQEGVDMLAEMDAPEPGPAPVQKPGPAPVQKSSPAAKKAAKKPAKADPGEPPALDVDPDLGASLGGLLDD